ncbi:division/cell wall cluster transcriptional repressor MraZ [Acuticoccus sp. I52.16.1]|uniref:division/cell wall cluster transcriptional repressor MraZ n=1 Tax=Acuticoccus sp. I52.16.1 TaxID=2928472 RepID=UPI001FD07FC3|nr:division/cell wall cluster transcriptional repressor MraZ [Acuticoccus sp. I52.16.1]UOM33605.1 division/cell wall cluster transcriptional repressor MraZ [Acuticoccus sp. I52.16.1]
MAGFVSNFTNKLDAKGRVSIPAPFRSALAKDGYDGLYCYRSFTAPTVDAGGFQLLNVLESRLADFDPMTEEHEALAMTFYGASEQLRIDSEGRVVFTDTIRKHAGIDKEVVFVGMNYKFQIWTPEKYEEHRQASQARALEVMRQAGSRGRARAAGGGGLSLAEMMGQRPPGPESPDR